MADPSDPASHDPDLPEGSEVFDDRGLVRITGVERWSYHPFQQSSTGDEQMIEVTAEREDGLSVRFAVPAYLGRGDEIREVAVVVIRARERVERTKGLGA
jgi:hypothetical protein